MSNRQLLLPEGDRDRLIQSLSWLMRRNGELERQLRQQRDANAGEQETLFLELLEVVDMLGNLSGLLHDAPEPSATVHKRIGRTIGASAAKLKGILEKRAVQAIPEPEAELDFALHKVVERELCPELPDHTPVKVLKQGYMVAGRVLRPTELITSRKSEE